MAAFSEKLNWGTCSKLHKFVCNSYAANMTCPSWRQGFSWVENTYGKTCFCQ